MGPPNESLYLPRGVHACYLSGVMGDTREETLNLGDEASAAELITLCDQQWTGLARAVEAKLRERERIDRAWLSMMSASGWPSRSRLRASVGPDGKLDRERLLTILRDCGRTCSRAGLSATEFGEVVQCVADELTALLVSAFAEDASTLIRMLGALQRCATQACLMMTRESSVDGEQALAEGRRLLAAAETKFDRLWESGLLGVIVCDFHGKIRSANDQFLEMFGYTRDDLASGRVRWAEMTPPEWRHLDEHAITQLTETGRTQPWEKEYYHKNGSRVPIMVGVSVLNEEETIAFVLDITERKYVETLRQRSSELEAENRQIQEANRLKGEFLANMSHELRTPLNAIIGFAELLLDGEVEASAPEHDEFLRDILNGGLHLQRLISDVLDLAKVEAGKIQFHPELTDVTRIVDEVCAMLRTVATEKRIELHATVEPSLGQVSVDPGRLKQIFYNYLSNALKFTDDGGRVEVEVSAEPGARFRIEVTDSGIGIAPSNLGKLFREFQQLEAGTNKRHPGTGLGLALTKRLVEAQGGSVGVNSELGRGSTFYAILPQNTAPAAALEPPPEFELPASATEVLVVEDDPRDRNLLVRTLGEAGFRTQTAATGSQAIASCEQQTFDAVTLDLLLPDLTGLQVLQRIRQTERNRHTPVVIVSVVAEQGVIRGFPVHDYLTKPVDESALVRTLRDATAPTAADGVILVVDDDPAARRLMELALKPHGYQVVCVDDGEAALSFTRDTRPLGIVLDLMMPKVDGFQFLTRFRDVSHNGAVPVIVWTTKDLTVQDRDALRRLAQGTVLKGEAKPVMLVNQLRRLIEHQRSLGQVVSDG